MKDKIRNLPVGLTGVALGTATLGAAWGNAHIGWVSYITLAIALFYFLSLILRNVLHFDVFKEELKHHVLGSYVPTMAMAMMVFAGILVKVDPILGKGLWLLAIGIHLICLATFVYHRMKNFSFEHMMPSWFVPPIGIVVACVNATYMGFPTLAAMIWWIATPLYFVMLAFMIYRLAFYKFDTVETFGIMAAPASLCFAGYLTITQNPNEFICHVLLTLSILMTSVLYIAFFHLLKRKFNPGFAAFTFPLAIGTVALQKYAKVLFTAGETTMAHAIELISYLELGVATCVIGYVVVKFYSYCKDDVLEFELNIKKVIYNITH
ncbi:TDT family transporter [Flammeovirga sp. SubArs3]|uniref:TDT family transporter n=1 Tax=Flammeovirga sp. SubArs3 TaxID=2995316 RepID=UPI00248BDEE7|nr:TDT family transporter [Flammeovirga sp. SubArs3]